MTNPNENWECSRRGCRWVGTDEQKPMRQSLLHGVMSWTLICPRCGCESFYRERPLFIPLKAEHYDAFDRGQKTEEYRQRGQRWNIETCRIGRRVILSRGYGKKHRLTGVITGCHYDTLPSRLPGWLDCYGPDAGDATVIQIQLDPK